MNSHHFPPLSSAAPSGSPTPVPTTTVQDIVSQSSNVGHSSLAHYYMSGGKD